jgi:hypothetical protein
LPVGNCTFLVAKTIGSNDLVARRINAAAVSSKTFLSKIDCQYLVEHTGWHPPIDERLTASVLTNAIKEISRQGAKAQSIHLKIRIIEQEATEETE